MMQEFFIPLRMPGLNEFLKEAYTSKYAAGAMKKEWTELTTLYARQAKLGHFTEPIIVEFHWYEPNFKRDQDNVAFAKKFIFDGLQDKNYPVISNDNHRWVKGFSDHFHYEGKEGVKIVMKEVKYDRKPNADSKRTTRLDGARKRL